MEQGDRLQVVLSCAPSRWRVLVFYVRQSINDAAEKTVVGSVYEMWYGLSNTIESVPSGTPE
jgi:hypothetical protein